MTAAAGAPTPEASIMAAARALLPRMVEWRRAFRRRPELGFAELETSLVVEEHLAKLGLQPGRVAGTGVVGVLVGSRPGPTLGLRADMDALPLDDEVDAEYRSQVAGVAHTCGHDAHTAMLMAAAEILASRADELHGLVKLVFQPAEESGLGGASAMLDGGVLDDPPVDHMAALHVAPSLPSGTLSVTSGVACAAVDWLEIAILGNGGHAAHPHQAVDVTVVAAQVITALQHIVSRKAPPLEPVVLTIGKVSGGVAPGVIAPRVDLSGTVRTVDPGLRNDVRGWVDDLVHGIANSFGARAEITYLPGIPALRNDDDLVEVAMATGRRLVGDDRCVAGPPSMGGEDFAFFAEAVPGVMVRLGVGDGTARTAHPLHHPRFDLDESAMSVGAAWLASLALHGAGAGPPGRQAQEDD